MKENRNRIFDSPILMESFNKKYGEKYKDIDLLITEVLEQGDLNLPGEESLKKPGVDPLGANKKVGNVGKIQRLKHFLNKQKAAVGSKWKALPKKGKIAAGVGAGLALGGGLAYAAHKKGGKRPAAETVIAFTKYGTMRFAEAQRAKGIDNKEIVENIVENLRTGMRKFCSECDNPSKCKSVLASEIAQIKFGTKGK